MSFIASYIYWHYTKAFVNIYGIFLNFLWATYRFFSISLLFRTFFAPWHHLDSGYSGNKLDVENFFGTFIVNTLMRIVGMCIKSVVLVLGIVSLIVVVVLEMVVFIIWIILPVIVVWLFYAGVLLTIK